MPRLKRYSLIGRGAVLCCLLMPLPASAQTLPISARDFFPSGRLFPCAAYSIGATDSGEEHSAAMAPWREGEIERARSAGINIIGPQYDLNSVVLADAEKFNMGAIYDVGSVINFEKWAGSAADIEHVKQEAAGQVSAVAANRRIVWWNLRTEELRPWRPKEMRYLEAVSAAVAEADGQKRALMMYEPGHRSVQELMETGKYLGVVSKGIYVNYSKMANERAWVAVAMGEQRAAARARGGKPVVFIPEMFADAPDRSMIARWTSHDMLRGVAEGAQAVLIFSFRRRAQFHDYDAYYAGYSPITKLICGTASLGQALLFGSSDDRIRVSQVSGSLAAPLVFRSQRYAPLSLGHVVRTYEGLSHIVLVNSSAAEIEASVDGLPRDPSKIEIEWSNGATVDLASHTIWLAPWASLAIKAKVE